MRFIEWLGDMKHMIVVLLEALAEERKGKNE
jgi:hypothetical protein